jgi:SAM-dependent methyltransferase
MQLVSRLLDMLRRRGGNAEGDLAAIARGVGAAILEATRLASSSPSLGGTEFVHAGSLRQFQEYRRRNAGVHRSRAALERLLAVPQAPFRYVGFDPCTGRMAEFSVDFDYATARDEDGLLLPNYRERLVSSATGLNCRQRATVLALRYLLAGRDPRAVSMYATEAITPLFAWIRAEYPRAFGSEYLGDAVAFGSSKDGVRNEDVTRLTFPDASFDVALSCDVLEHVPAYEQAFRELRRILRPGGFLLATVPFRRDCEEHLIRARLSPSGAVEHLEAPEYHGDPVQPERGVLCYQHFGWRLLDDLREAGFRDASALLTWSYHHGILGGDQVLFHAKA